MGPKLAVKTPEGEVKIFVPEVKDAPLALEE
jgi:hypothetical protein